MQTPLATPALPQLGPFVPPTHLPIPSHVHSMHNHGVEAEYEERNHKQRREHVKQGQ